MNSRVDSLDRRVRILLVDDDEEDRLITHLLLAENGAGWFELDWEASYDAGLETMQRNEHDVYLLDYRLGGRDGVELLREAIDRGCHGPLILLTGQGDHDVDVLAMKAGAVDYLVKGRIDAALLERAVRYAIERNLFQRQREGLIRDLENALAEIKTLGGLLPICSSCKKIRDDTGYWNQIETYIRDHSEVEFSHSLCPPCVRVLYPFYYEKAVSWNPMEDSRGQTHLPSC